jgi:hypothetical protein
LDEFDGKLGHDSVDDDLFEREGEEGGLAGCKHLRSLSFLDSRDMDQDEDHDKDNGDDRDSDDRDSDDMLFRDQRRGPTVDNNHNNNNNDNKNNNDIFIMNTNGPSVSE